MGYQFMTHNRNGQYNSTKKKKNHTQIMDTLVLTCLKKLIIGTWIETLYLQRARVLSSNDSSVTLK